MQPLPDSSRWPRTDGQQESLAATIAADGQNRNLFGDAAVPRDLNALWTANITTRRKELVSVVDVHRNYSPTPLQVIDVVGRKCFGSSARELAELVVGRLSVEHGLFAVPGRRDLDCSRGRVP